MVDHSKVNQVCFEAIKKAMTLAEEIRPTIKVLFKEEKGENFFVKIARQVVTKGDIEIQNLILKIFLENGFSNCQIYAEENVEGVMHLDQFANDSSERIFIDPIDGTIYYILKNPEVRSKIEEQISEEEWEQIQNYLHPDYYEIVLGFESSKKPILGIAALPVQQIIYWSDGLKSYRNSQIIQLITKSQTRKRIKPKKLVLHPSIAHFQDHFQDKYDTTSACVGFALSMIIEGFYDGWIIERFERGVDYTMQIPAMIAKCAGLVVMDKNMNDFPISDFATPKKSLIVAKTQEIAAELASILRQIKNEK